MARGDEVSGLAALSWVGGLGVALLLTAAGISLLQRSLRRQARQERASLATDPLSLRRGPVALSGTVETMDGDGAAPPVTATLEGNVTARKFLLRLESGLRVEVDPGQAPILRDALEKESGARLSPGERVYVRGTLRAPIVPGLPHAERPLVGPTRWRRVRLSTQAFSGELDRRAAELDFQKFALLATLVLSQLPYLGLYLEGVRHWFSDGPPPVLSMSIFLCVLLVAGSVIAGSVASAWTERLWRSR